MARAWTGDLYVFLHMEGTDGVKFLWWRVKGETALGSPRWRGQRRIQ